MSHLQMHQQDGWEERVGIDRDKNRHSNVKVVLIAGVMRRTIGSGTKSEPRFSFSNMFTGVNLF